MTWAEDIPTLKQDEFRLVARAVEARGVIPPGVQHLEVRSMDNFLGGLEVSLRGYILSHEVDRTEHRVRAEFQRSRPATWLDYCKHGLRLKWPRLFQRLKVDYTAETVVDYVTATCHQHATFPEATLRYPKELGEVVIYKHEWGVGAR